MAFKAAFSYKGLPETPEAYIRLNSLYGAPATGYEGMFKIYASEDVRLNSLDDHLIGAEFTKHIDYRPGEDPATMLYEAAKENFVNPVDV